MHQVKEAMMYDNERKKFLLDHIKIKMLLLFSFTKQPQRLVFKLSLTYWPEVPQAI